MDELVEFKKFYWQSYCKKVFLEIYLICLFFIKGMLQKFLDDLFKVILSICEDKFLLVVKYFFDFLEEQVEKRGIFDFDILYIWKINSFFFWFWVNILKNFQFVFDIDKIDYIDVCFLVIVQVFIDVCFIFDLQLGKDLLINKFFYVKEIFEYWKIVQCYYKQIQDMMLFSE